MMPATKNQGWAKIAWSMGFNQLKQCSNIDNEVDLSSKLFKKCMYNVISQGGDTDTNAAIVGGLVGAIIGFNRLPKYYLERMMKLRYGERTTATSRPSRFEPRRILSNALKAKRNFKEQ